ncbi:MAG TPA: adenylate/guanylate cyclase domain-containing protein [Acidimicrobiales bacterium]|nr:adenylate/guanylate cyclase domain-containing protein [Acidimicrobiales bacterium]
MSGTSCLHCGLEIAAGTRFCGGCGRPLQDRVAISPADPRDTAQRRHMTVMFCDLVGSTLLAESLDPEDLREVIGDYQHACARAIERFGGHTAKYVGDGVVVYFGYPRAHEDDPQRAVHAGLGILDEVSVLNEHRDTSLRVRIGVHTGLVVAGEMGAGQTREQLAIVGETPHIAARLESIAEPDTVVVSQATCDLIEGFFETQALGEKALKGVSRPVGTYRVVSATGAVSRLEAVGARRLPPLVGRDPDLARLGDAWRRVAAGHGAVAHVAGEAGIGKSRLVRALHEQLGDRVGAVQVWQCSAHHQSSSLHPVIRFLERDLLLEGTDSAERRLQVLDEAVRDAGVDPVEAVPLLASLLSLPAGDEAARPALMPRDARALLLRSLESLLVANTARHPLLLIVEDLHWADPTTVELLGRIVTSVPNIPVLCVLTFRRNFQPPWGSRQPDLEIELGRLTPEDVRAMLRVGRGTALDAPVLERVIAAADGVPLFVEEMVRMLDVNGRPRPVGTDTAKREADATVVPSSLLGLLTERLDRLARLREVIDVAAVLGREFPRELLEALEPLDRAALERALAELVSEGVLRPIGGPRPGYEFSHALLQEAAYDLLLRRHRQVLHARVADLLTRRFAAVAKREPEVVAHHWIRAAEPAKAVPWWHAAGTRALERAAFLEAAEHFRRGLDALDVTKPGTGEDLQRVEFLSHLAASLQAGRGYAASGVDDAYAEARSACERVRNRDRLVSVIRGQWMFHLLRAEYGTALDLADEMLALGERGDHPARLAEGHLYRGLVHMYLADLDMARDHLDESINRYESRDRSDRIYEAQGDTGVGALAYIAPVLWNLGYDKESRERSDLSLELAEQVGGPVTRAQAWGMRTLMHLTRGEGAELLHWTEKTRAHSADRNIAYWRILSSLIWGWLHGRAGELDAGITQVQGNLDAYLSSGSRLGLPLFHILLSDLWLAAGNQRQALDVLRVGEEHIEATGERFSESELFHAKGRLLMAARSPDPRGASAAYERAVTAARQQHAKRLELRAAIRLAEHQRAIGETLTDLAQLASLCDWFGVTSELPDVARARALVTAEPNAR